MNNKKLSRTLHKWFGLIIGLQVFIWLGTGLYMVIVDLDFIHGDPLVRNMQQVVRLPLPPSLTVADLQIRYPQATQITLQVVGGETFYLVSTANDRILLDPRNAKVVSPLKPDSIRALAAYHFNGEADIDTITLIRDKPPSEIGVRPLPLWRVDFNDRFKTSFYIDPVSGELVTRRHQYWRIFDFLWMLHIMDYAERSNAHNLLLKGAQFLGLTLAITGIWLLFYRFRPRKQSTRR